MAEEEKTANTKNPLSSDSSVFEKDAGRIGANIQRRSLWNRVGHVEIDIGGGKKKFDFSGLDFKFKITQILGKMPEGNMEVSICGLSQNTANEIVTVCDTMTALKMQKRVRVYAGYARKNDPNYKGELIATMDIINACVSSPPPDMWVSITGVVAGFYDSMTFTYNAMGEKYYEKGFAADAKAVAYGAVDGAVHAVSEVLKIVSFGLIKLDDRDSFVPTNDEIDKRIGKIKPINLYEMCEDIADKLNLFFNQHGINTHVSVDFSKAPESYKYITGRMVKHLRWSAVRSFQFSGTLKELPTKINESFSGFLQWEDRGTSSVNGEVKLYLCMYEDPRLKAMLEGTKEVKNQLAKNNSTVRNRYLSVDTGLIGIPKVKNATALHCRSLLDEELRIGDMVSLNSQVMPALNTSGWKDSKISELNKLIDAAKKVNANNTAAELENEKKKINELYADKSGAFRDANGEWHGWQVMKLTHTGHMRGNEWYTDIVAMDYSRLKFVPNSSEVEPQENITLKNDRIATTDSSGSITGFEEGQ